MIHMGKIRAHGRKVIALLLIISLVFGAGVVYPADIVQAASIKLSKTKVKVMVKGTASIKLEGAAAKKVKWASKNKKIATVSGGKIKGIKKGTTEIVATYNKKKYRASVTVSDVPFFESKSVELLATTTKTVTLTGAKASQVKWSSKNKKIATVTRGKIKGIKKGSTTITARYKNKNYTLTAKVLSMPKLSSSKLSLATGKTSKLKLTGATASKTSWKSSNTKVATVSSSGLVKGMKAGTATITAIYYGKAFKCAITVKAAATTSTNKSPYEEPDYTVQDWGGNSSGESDAKVYIKDDYWEQVASYEKGNISLDGSVAESVDTLGSNTSFVNLKYSAANVTKALNPEEETTLGDEDEQGVEVTIPKGVSVSSNRQKISGDIQLRLEKDESYFDAVKLKAYVVNDTGGGDTLNSSDALDTSSGGSGNSSDAGDAGASLESKAPLEEEPAVYRKESVIAERIYLDEESVSLEEEIPPNTDAAESVGNGEPMDGDTTEESVGKTESVGGETAEESFEETKSDAEAGLSEETMGDAESELSEETTDAVESDVSSEALEAVGTDEADRTEGAGDAVQTDETAEGVEVQWENESDGLLEEGEAGRIIEADPILTESAAEDVLEETVEIQTDALSSDEGEISHPIFSEPVTISLPISDYDETDIDRCRGVYYYTDENGSKTAVYLVPDKARLKEDHVAEFSIDHFSTVSVVRLKGMDAYRHAAHLKAINDYNYKERQGLFENQEAMEEMVTGVLRDTGVGDEVASMIYKALGNYGELIELADLSRDSRIDTEEAHKKMQQIVAKKILDVYMQKAGEKVPGLDILTDSAECGVEVYDKCLNGDYDGAYKSVMTAVANNLPLVKYGKFCNAVCEAGADCWTDVNMEEMYKAYCGKEIKWRPGADACDGDLELLESTYAGPFNAYYIQRYKDFCSQENGLSFNELMRDEYKDLRESLRIKFRREWQQEFKERREKDKKIEAAESEIVGFLVACEMYGLLERGRLGFGIENTATADATDYDRVERLLQVKEQIDAIFKAEGMTAEQAFMSNLYTNPKANTNARYADLIKVWLNTDNTVNGRRAALAYIQQTYGKYHLSQTEVSTKLYKRGRLKLYNGAGKDIASKATWTSSDTAIATVDKGVVATLWPGEVTITASYAEREFQCKITVNDPVSITPTSKTLKEGESFSIKVNGLQTPDPAPAFKANNYSTGTLTADPNGTVKCTKGGTGNARIEVTLSKSGCSTRTFVCDVAIQGTGGSESSTGGTFNPVGSFSGTYWRKSTGTTVGATARIVKSTPAAAGYTSFTDDGTWYEIWYENAAGVGSNNTIIRIDSSTGKITYGNVNGTFTNNGNKLEITNALGSFKYVLTK